MRLPVRHRGRIITAAVSSLLLIGHVPLSQPANEIRTTRNLADRVSAPSTSGQWTEAVAIAPALRNAKATLSACTSKRACEFVLLVGSREPLRVYAIAYNGRTRVVNVQLHSVRGATGYELSCAGSGNCLLISRNGYAYREHDGKWSTSTDMDPAASRLHDSITSVSCASANFCVAGTFDGDALRWDGSTWSAAKATGLSTVYAVSCPRPSFCLAVSNASQSDNTAAWNGTKWSLVQRDPIGEFAYAVSCTSAQWCMAVGGNLSGRGDLSATWDGAGWHSVAVPRDARTGFGFNSVSCSSPTLCLASDGGVHAATLNRGDGEFVWGGSAWTGPHLDGRSSFGFHSTSSCGASTFCASTLGATVSFYG